MASHLTWETLELILYEMVRDSDVNTCFAFDSSNPAAAGPSAFLDVHSLRRKHMGCLFAVIALMVPRVLIVAIALLTDWFGRSFESRMWPILGFVFMPYTTLAYLAAMMNNYHTLSGGWLAVFIVAILVDAGHWGGGGLKYRNR
jgi:hypothetical protein